MAEAPATPLPIAVQLYTFRDPARFGGPGLGLDEPTLRSIADAGFLGVETVEVPGGDPVAARRLLAELGLAVVSAHTWADVADPEAFAAASAGIAELGTPRIIVSGRFDATVDAVESTIDRLGAAADIAARHGLRLGYHNHSGEMAVVEGTRIIDRIAAGLGDAIDFQVDIFWVVVGGADPAAVIGGLGERVVSLHVKDGVEMPASAHDDTPFVNVVVGTGIVDPVPAIAAAEAAGSVGWLIVEFDGVEGSPIAAARASLDSLVDHGLGRAAHP